MEHPLEPDRSAPAGGAAEPDLPGIDPPSGWTDASFMTDGPMFWARLMTSEAARVRRYRRSATVVLFELAGLDHLGRMWGSDVAAHALIRTVAILTSQIRSSDHAARIAMARFGIYLPETTEIDAINFVERTRAAMIADLGRSGELVIPAFGWASPNNGDLEAAVAIADERLGREIAAALERRPSEGSRG